MNWQLAEAKNKLSEVVSLAIHEGPQFISRRGETVVMLSQNDYAELKGQSVDFKQFLLKETPSLEGLSFRGKDIDRNIEL